MVRLSIPLMALMAALLFRVSTSALASERIPGWDPRFHRLDLGAAGRGVGAGRRTGPGAVTATDAGDFLVAGRFTNIQNKALLNLARWNRGSWLPPLPDDKGVIALRPAERNDLDTGIFALTTRGQEIFLGGDGVLAAGGQAVQNIAWWNGAAWSDMSGGTTGRVTVLAVDGSRVYAGGRFDRIGGVQAANIAVWNGDQWAPLGDGVPFVPSAIAVFQGQPCLSTTDSAPEVAHKLLRWTGAAWEPLGNAFQPAEPGLPFCLLTRPEGLYVGGEFTEVAGVQSWSVALWNGTAWESPPIHSRPESSPNFAAFFDVLGGFGKQSECEGQTSLLAALGVVQDAVFRRAVENPPRMHPRRRPCFTQRPRAHGSAGPHEAAKERNAAEDARRNLTSGVDRLMRAGHPANLP